MNNGGFPAECCTAQLTSSMWHCLYQISGLAKPLPSASSLDWSQYHVLSVRSGGGGLSLR